MSEIKCCNKYFRILLRILKWAVIIIPILIVVAFIGIGAVTADIAFSAQREFSLNRTPADFNLAFQEVSFPARGGDMKIAGWYIPNEGKTRAIILVHGRNQSRTSEFYGSFIDLAATLQKGGYNILMIDLRGHGQSGDAHISFGIKEKLDVEGAADWLKAQGIKPGNIGVLGISLGAASSIGAAADDRDIAAVVSDSCFASIQPVLQSQWDEYSGLPDLFFRSILLISRLLYGCDIAASRPVDDIARIAPRPVLIIHSNADQFIPVKNAEELEAAYPGAEYWIVDGPEHARIYNAVPAAYSQKVIEFFKRNLPD